MAYGRGHVRTGARQMRISDKRINWLKAEVAKAMQAAVVKVEADYQVWKAQQK